MAVRILVVDASGARSDGLHRALLRSSDLEPLGFCSSGREALRLAMDVRPDVVVASTTLEHPNAFELARYLKLRMPSLAVVLLTSHASEEELYEAVRVGVSAYLPADTPFTALLNIARQASLGEYLIDDSVLTQPRVAARVLREFRDIHSAANELVPLLAPLSQREIEILEQIARGRSNKQIARRLSISDQTVKNHISSILRKLAVNDRTQAVVFALRHGWIRVEESS